MTATSYHGRLREAARRALQIQEGDGGWGLREGYVSSIVNTAETLFILHSANGVFPSDGLDATAAPVTRAVKFLCAALRTHPLPPEEGGRGSNARFMSFGLLGLLEYPEFADQVEVRDSIELCRAWFSQNVLERGWPERTGQPFASLFQTAQAVRALDLLDPADDLIDPAREMLTGHQLENGSWSLGVSGSRGSPSQTALCVLALLGGTPTDAMAARRGTRWLMEHTGRWLRSSEVDPDVLGTSWTHMTFSLALRAVLADGIPPSHVRLAPVFPFLSDLWNYEERGWREGVDAVVSTRGSYAVVLAYEAVKSAFSRMDPEDVLAAMSIHESTPDLDGPRVSLVILDRPMVELLLGDGSSPCRVRLTESQWEVLLTVFLHGGIGEGRWELTTGDLALRRSVMPESIAKTVGRLNKKVQFETSGRVKSLMTRGTDDTFRLLVSRATRAPSSGQGVDDG